MTDPDTRTFGDVGTSLLHEDDHIRVWELRLEPGESSDLHHHQHDYLMVQIEGDEIAARFEPDSTGSFAGADQLQGPVSPGMAIFAEAGGRETAINIGTKTFREVIVELKDTVERAQAEAAAAPSMMPLQHVSLSVRNVAEALPFYTDALGFELLPRPDFGIAGAWMATGNGVQIHLIEDPNFEATPGPHVAFETTDIHAEIERLKGLGVTVGDPFELNGQHQAFFNDPSGNQFELNQPGTAGS